MIVRGRVRIRYDDGVRPAMFEGIITAQTDKALRIQSESTITGKIITTWIFIHNIYTIEEL